mmetsp:Transcript_1316/g.2616  ORF Transcript_1316/g.2616 Transcript_1316/m.2616 type:complete len:163 (+) Transcript_1316:205-693(+)
MAKHTAMIWWLKFLQFVAVLVLIIIGFMFGYGLVSAIRYVVGGGAFRDAWYVICLGLYGFVFTIMCFLNEIKVKSIRKEFPFFHGFAKRGLFYVLVGLLSSLSGIFATDLGSISRDTMSQIIFISSIILIAIGALYIIMAVLFLQHRAKKDAKSEGMNEDMV